MTIQKLYEIPLDTDENIMAATMSKSNEIVMLMSSGNVIRFNLDEQKGKHLFSVKSSLAYSDGGFDISAKTSIYTIDEIVVVVNDFKRHGFIHYPDKYHALHLWREDYHADISCYPIAFYKSKTNVPHIIYGVAWNHIQIMNLETRQVLTAAKSLIEENAEERHIEFYKKHKENNKLAWPRSYDYFFGKLKISPNRQYFLSAGWAWGSYDAYNIYNIRQFIDSNRITDINIGGWEHENRAVCWINNNEIAVVYNPFTEGDENSNEISPNEIHFYKLTDKKVDFLSKIKIENLNLVAAEIEFNDELNSIVAFSDKIGVAVISLDGNILYQNVDLRVNNYYTETSHFITTNEKAVLIYKLIK